MKLGQIHFITSAAELQGALADIEKSGLSVAKKRDKKLSLLKDKIKIRKKSISRTKEYHSRNMERSDLYPL